MFSMEKFSNDFISLKHPYGGVLKALLKKILLSVLYHVLIITTFDDRMVLKLLYL